MPVQALSSLKKHISKEDVLRLLPHRGKALKIDRAIFVCGKVDSIFAYKLIRAEDPDFEGHYPGNPIYPGNSMIEGANLAAALLIKMLYPDISGLPLSAKVEIEFIRVVKPGSELEINVHLVSSFEQKGSKTFRFSVEIRNEKNKKVASGFVEGKPGRA
jgi:3-hydroxyacyl-[acyl-carrier-protein] dehydratase